MFHARQFPLLRPLIWVVVLLISSSSLVGCQCLRDLFGGGKPGPINQGKADISPPNEVNFSLSAVVSDAQIKSAFVTSFTALTPVDIVVRRCKCDAELINVALPGSYTVIIKGVDGPLVVKSGDGSTGGDIDLPLTGAEPNYRVSLGIREQYSKDEIVVNRLIDTSQYNPGKTVKIAIFDTGFDQSYLPNNSWKTATSQCVAVGGPTSNIGWNFTPDGPEIKTDDNSPIKHGSRVANLLVRQFNGGSFIPKLIPMKVLSGPDNQGDLFELMCAMETARKAGIRIFNMSLGYYGDEDLMLKERVRRAANDGVLLVAGAGNRADSTVNRDLATMMYKFYPAAFSTDFDQVIPVATVSLWGSTPGSTTLVGCALQNYGSATVLGVLADEACRFKFTPFTGEAALIEGSSYATPLLAGWLARKRAENPAQVVGRASLPTSLSKATTGTQIYQNAYLRPVQVSATP